MAKAPVQGNTSGPDLKALGLKSPMEVIDILSLLKIDGAPVITDDKVALNPQLKAENAVKHFHEKFNVKPNVLPYLASVIKRKLKAGKLNWGT